MQQVQNGKIVEWSMEIKKQEWDITYEVALQFRKVLFRTHAHSQSLF